MLLRHAMITMLPMLFSDYADGHITSAPCYAPLLLWLLLRHEDTQRHAIAIEMPHTRATAYAATLLPLPISRQFSLLRHTIQRSYMSRLRPALRQSLRLLRYEI